MFANCKCEQCDLIETRRKLDQHIKKRRSDSNRRRNCLTTIVGEKFATSPKTDLQQQQLFLAGSNFLVDSDVLKSNEIKNTQQCFYNIHQQEQHETETTSLKWQNSKLFFLCCNFFKKITIIWVK